ncbi:ABC transporter ATP-binding protein [Paenibacillus sp. A14]|uniref:ABC transporter ATP-binding protein n=1 Tax=Paenibacillus sp. A14 TaxID=3119820 RepID=UPI002FE0F8A5
MAGLKVDLLPADEAETPVSEPTAVEVRDLRLKFPGEEAFVFKDLTFRVRRGEKLLLLGPSGSGKSTLLQVLSGMIPELVDVPLRYSERVLPSSWGMLFQDPDTQFCMPYVDEELAFVLENRRVPREEMVPRMLDVLRKVGLRLKELHVPIDTLSQGMKQRLALASILLMEPEVLFLDEPSALLDPDGRRQIWQAVREVAEARTLIIVEHRIEELLELELVDRVALFGPEGRLLGQGTPEELFRHYRQELLAYGIWHPGVWNGYISAFPEAHGRCIPKECERVANPHEQAIVVRGPGQVAEKPGQAAPLTRREAVEQPVIVLSDFRGFRQGRPVIHAGQASVYPGDFIAVTGPNGAGKSSLLLSLMGLLPSEGSYRLSGRDMSWSKLRKKFVQAAAREIGFVFQNPEFQFVENQVAKEIAFSLQEEKTGAEEVSRRVDEALIRFGLAGLEMRHPYQLSLGQKRRLSVAGAAVLQRPVLLLDEPTFGQDAVNTFAILDLCEELRREGTAILMVTHEEKIAETVATRKWEVRDGVLTDCGLTERSGMRMGMWLDDADPASALGTDIPKGERVSV